MYIANLFPKPLFTDRPALDLYSQLARTTAARRCDSGAHARSASRYTLECNMHSTFRLIDASGPPVESLWRTLRSLSYTEVCVRARYASHDLGCASVMRVALSSSTGDAMAIKINRSHAMPFGTEVLDGGRVRFRVWAPAAEKVTVCLGSGEAEAVLPLAAEQEGRFRIVTEQSLIGTHYRFEIERKQREPEPASRFQPQDVHGPSEVIDPCAWEWQDSHWHGRPLEESVIYEF